MGNHILIITYLVALLVLHASSSIATDIVPHTTHNNKTPRSQRLTVSSRKACRFDIDCGRDSFCAPPSGTPGLCKPRLPINASCPDPQEADACKPGLFCSYEGRTSSFRPIRKCRPHPRLGQSCGFDYLDPCVSPLLCDSSSSKCRAPRNSLQDGKCDFDRDCRSNKGLFCDISKRVCMPVLKFGAVCDSTLSQSSCPGYCRTMKVGPFTANDFCREQAPLGSVCTEDKQCAFSKTRISGPNSSEIDPRSDRAVCNRMTTMDYGVCVMYSKLKKRVGERCNGRINLCDHARGLSCRWASKFKTTVCQHYHTHHTGISKFCEIGSPLSKCPSTNYECRYAQKGREPLNNQLDFPMCYERRVYLPPGSRCEFESARCTKGARCRAVPGVTRQLPRSFDPGQPVKYCVMVRDLGGLCKSKFKEQCRDGLTCVGGICKKQNKSKKVNVTHSGFRGRCDKLPCAPGLLCRPKYSGGTKLCLSPRVVAGVGQSCGYNSLKEIVCKDSLACRVDANGSGNLLCRPRAKIGEFCDSNDSHCRKGLKCASQISQGRHMQDSRCINPKNSLSLGAKCSPPKARSDRPCVPKLSGDFGRRCLPKGDKFACQVDVGLFGMCNAKKNRVCGDQRLTCSKAGICVSKN